MEEITVQQPGPEADSNLQTPALPSGTEGLDPSLGRDRMQINQIRLLRRLLPWQVKLLTMATLACAVVAWVTAAPWQLWVMAAVLGAAACAHGLAMHWSRMRLVSIACHLTIASLWLIAVALPLLFSQLIIGLALMGLLIALQAAVLISPLAGYGYVGTLTLTGSLIFLLQEYQLFGPSLHLGTRINATIGVAIYITTILTGMYLIAINQAATRRALGQWIRQSEALTDANRQLASEMLERKLVETALQQARAGLERRVAERTAQLTRVNEALRAQIAQRKRVEQALRESEERYALSTRGANDGLWDWDLKTNQIYYSSRWKSMLGIDEEEVKNRPEDWFNRVLPEDRDQIQLEISAHLEGLSPHLECEYRMLHQDGSIRWMLTRGIAVREPGKKAYRMAGSQTDITDRKRAEEQLLHDAFHDALTGLPNRALFLDRLGRAIERTKRSRDSLFAVLFLDLDRFKLVNDSFGHIIGDQLLVELAHQLEGCLRGLDTVARLGGDEFVILLEEVEDLDEVIHVADRIQKELATPLVLDSHEVYTSASIGIVLSTLGYQRPVDVLRDADIAMYRAKARGKAQFTVFDPTMRARAVAMLQVETDLRRALGRQEFETHYQPIIALANQQITGFEALVRWQHPERGLVAPTEFLSVAEETGLIAPIDWWVLHEACRQLLLWQKRFPMDPPLTMSVNLSSRHFSQFDLVTQLENILQATGVNPTSLHLEITENTVMENAEPAGSILARIRNLGVRVHLDDFGVGYSSLSYLNRFPVSAIKIDRSFVSQIENNDLTAGILPTIVRLARDLQMDIVAEGVETKRQFDQLKALNCNFGQGFLFSRPLDQQAAERLLTLQAKSPGLPVQLPQFAPRPTGPL